MIRDKAKCKIIIHGKEKNGYYTYVHIPDAIKRLGRRYNKLNNKFSVLLHYLKVRSKKRRFFESKLTKINRILKKIEAKESDFNILFGQKVKRVIQKRGNRQGAARTYLLTLEHKDILRLRQLLKRQPRKASLTRLGKGLSHVEANTHVANESS